MTKYNILYFAILLFSVSFTFSQQPYFKHYKTENGLSHNTVNTILKDGKGFMWFGTKAGLNRFDGVSFKIFQNNSKNPKSLGSNYVRCLHEFNDELWVGTDIGLFKFNYELEGFDIIPVSENNSVFDIENDNEGNLWFISGETLFKYNTDSGIVSNCKTNFIAKHLTKTPDGKIWASQNDNLFQYSKENNSFNRFKVTIKTSDRLPIRISRIFALNSNEIVIGTENNGAILFNISQNSFKTLITSSKESIYVRDFAIKGDNELWIATESGIFIYNLLEKTYINFKKNYSDHYSLSDNALYSLAVDNEDGLWIGSYFGGVNFCPKQYTPFKKYFPKINENSISGVAVREIHPDKYGNLWIGTEDAGLNKLNPKTGLFTQYKPTVKAKSISHYNIHGILPRENELWVGTFEHGLDILDIKTGKKVKHFGVEKKNAIGNNFIFSLYENSNKTVFALTPSGIFKYFDDKSVFLSYEGFPEGNFYTSMLEDQNGAMWAGSYWNGLFYYNPETKIKKQFIHDRENPNSISHNTINGIFKDSKNNLWVTTENGLNFFDSQKKEFKNYTTEDGFPSNAFYSIIEDKDILWISTSKGLVAYNTGNKSIKVYTKSNGLLSDQFNYNSAYKAEDGTMYFGSVEGMISFNPKYFEKNDFQPQTYITGLHINNKEILVNSQNSPINKSITYLDELIINPNETSFTIDFATLSYIAPETIEYWYKLEGLDNRWIPIDKNHQVSFTGLSPGSYKFAVKSQNDEGIWNIESSPLKIKILPPFWKSGMAYIIYFLIAGLVSFIIIRFYHLRVKAKNKLIINNLNNRKEKELYQSKIEFFTNVSHEIRTPLTLIKGPLEKLLKSPNYNKTDVNENLTIMDKNATRLLDLVNQLLDFRKTELQSVSLTFIEVNISELIRKIITRFSQTIKNKNINLQTNLGASDIYAYVDLEALKKILSNLFNNAIKYSENLIIINLLVNDKNIELTIKNDGILVPTHLKNKIFEPFFRVEELEKQDNLGTGIGLPLAHSLVELHKGSLELDTSNPNLNSFILKMPIHQKNEFNIRSPKNSDIIEGSNSEEISSKNKEHKPTIVLIEDNLDLLEFMAKDLTKDYFVIKTTNGKKGLEVLDEESVQLIISDVMMPGINGFELCEKVKTKLETSHIPVILLTAKAGTGAKIEGLESGADSYIEKPFSMDYLKVQISNLLENRKHIMDHYSSSPLAHVRSIAHTKVDDVFIKKLDSFIFNNISDPNLSVDTLAENMNMSRATLYRKIKNISSLTPSDLINISRLKKAGEILKTGEYKIYEVAEMVGYSSGTSFGRSFQKQFGMSPSEYTNSNSY